MNRFEILDILGKGGFSRVYKVKDTQKKIICALKIDLGEVAAGSRSLSEYEYLVMRELQAGGKLPGIPMVHWFGDINTKKGVSSAIAIDILGEDLEKIMERKNGKLSVIESFHITRSLFRTIAHVHSRGFLHRDIKPANCMVGYCDDDMIYLSDFGLSKRFILEGGAHIPRTKKEGVTGTPRFCSVNVHERIESSRRDDLESIFYVMIYMIKGKLPWQGCKNKDNIFEIKKNISFVELCSIDINNKSPQVIKNLIEIISYIRSLGFDENPKYKLILNKMKDNILFLLS